MTILSAIVAVVFILSGSVWLGLELFYRRRPTNDLDVTNGTWELATQQPQRYVLVGEVIFSNPCSNAEVMIPELQPEVKLLSKGSLAGIETTVNVTPEHPDFPAREDGFWFAYIVKTRKQTQVRFEITITGADLSQLQMAWIKVNYIAYGPKGRLPRTHHVMMPLAFPNPDDSSRWRTVATGDVLPIRTHLLTPLDDPITTVKRYVLPHAKPGDIVTIGETPVAIMQGRWQHPANLQPGWVAKRVCQFFLPTSSLATACGMQALVEIVGPTRVLLAFLGGVVGKAFGQAGMFYRLAGEQARLIDDVTGTLPPYDHFIVLGPDQPQQVVDQIQQQTGLAAAIVDVNDLKAVKILALSAGIPTQVVEEALRSNPAGNGDEQTPVVLIRPKEPLSATRAFSVK